MAQLPPSASAALLLALLVVLASPLAAHADLSLDAQALSAFILGLDRRPPKLTWPPNTSNNVCSWHGVSCTSSPPIRVSSLRLPAIGLTGPIRENTLGRLSSLLVLSLHNNNLYGPLPHDLANCTQLRALYLHNNHLSGPLPPLPPLIIRVNLAYNNFSSPIPSSYPSLPRLGTLYLQNNSLSGPFPTSLADLLDLSQFNVAYNHLYGAIPSSLQQKFGPFAFSGNSFCGSPIFSACDNTPPSSLYPPSPSYPQPYSQNQGTSHSSHKHLSTIVIVAISIGSVLLFAFLIVLLICIAKKRRSRRQEGTKLAPVMETPPPLEVQSNTPKEVLSEQPSIAQPPSVINKLVFLEGNNYTFDLDELLRASAEVLGKGKMGTSYKAVLEDGTTLVVKRIKDVSLGQKEFGQHIELLGGLKNRHLVPLKAYYYSKEEKLLLLDYLPMGSLSALLHGNRGAGRNTLNWTTRVKIATGVAKGIAFLHNQGDEDHKLNHGNIKSSNVLVSQDYEASISDYSLAPLFASSPTILRIGGYMAPEVVDTKRASKKSDVYSFGVLLLELLTGKDPIQASHEEGIDLPTWVQSLARDEWTSEVFDAELIHYNQHINQDDLMQVLRVAISCVAKSPDQRPTMGQVVSLLEDVSSRQYI